jgi:hypothetical protein
VAALRTRAMELYGFPATGIPAIESSFKLSAGEFDGEFNHLHAEQLLEHASVLLERCEAHRSRRDQLLGEKWQLQMELDRFFRLDRVEERERAAGKDTLDYERTVLESAAEQSLADNHKHAGEQLKDLTSDLVESGLNRRMAAKELSSWISAFPLKDTELRGDDASYTFDGVRKTKPEHLFDAARQEADEDAWEQIYTLTSERYTALAESEAARLRKQSLDLQANWSLSEIAFRRERDQAVRDAVWEKVYQVQSTGGALNCSERIARVERDFSLDFRETMACLGAARRGLEELYGYAPPFPQEGAPGYFDDVASWVRTAQNRMAQFSRLDQHYVLAVSLKQVTGSQWEAGLTRSEWTFDLPDDMFAGQSHVRLRGLSASVTGPVPELAAGQKAAAQKPAAPTAETPKAEGFWSARISLAATGTVRGVTGPARELDQKSLPVCCLGRVTDRDSSQEPEIGGAAALHNASPIGRQWKVALSPKSTDGMATAKLKDVQIYLHLAVRA